MAQPLQFQFNLLPWSAELNAGAGGLKSSTANDDYHDSRRQSQRSTSCLCSWQFSSVALRGRLVGFSVRGALVTRNSIVSEFRKGLMAYCQRIMPSICCLIWLFYQYQELLRSYGLSVVLTEVELD